MTITLLREILVPKMSRGLVAGVDKTTRNHETFTAYKINDSSILVEAYVSVALHRGSTTLTGETIQLHRFQYLRVLAHFHLGDLHTSRSAQGVADQFNHSFANNLQNPSSRVFMTLIPIVDNNSTGATRKFVTYGENLSHFSAKDTYDGTSLSISDPVDLSSKTDAGNRSDKEEEDYVSRSEEAEAPDQIQWQDITSETMWGFPSVIAKAFGQFYFFVEPFTQRLALRVRGMDDGQGDTTLMDLHANIRFADQKVIRVKVDFPGYDLRKLLGVKTTHYTLRSDAHTFGVLARGEHGYGEASCKGLTFPRTVNYITVPRLMVYSDIVLYTHFGPTEASVIAIVENGTVFGRQYSWSASKIMYVPVKTNYIDQIHIVIRDEVGHEVKFEAGSVMIQLYFRKRI